MLKKEDVLRIVDNLPPQFTLDEIIDELVLIDKINRGLEQSQKGEVLSTVEARQRLSKWLQ
jgi:predicted transcriptional regulator